MEIKNFEHSNIVIGKDQPEYIPIPALHLDDEFGTMFFCFSISDEELEIIKERKEMWVSVLTFGQKFQPIFLSPKQEEMFKVTYPVGKCKICGCTQDNPCTHPEVGTCWWVNDNQDLCSHCAQFADDNSVERPFIKMTPTEIRQAYLAVGKIPVRMKSFISKGRSYDAAVSFNGKGWNKIEGNVTDLQKLIDMNPDTMVLDDEIIEKGGLILFDLNKHLLPSAPLVISKEPLPQDPEEKPAKPEALRFFGTEITNGGKWQIFEEIDGNKVRVKSIKPFASKKLADAALEDFLVTKQNYCSVNYLASM